MIYYLIMIIFKINEVRYMKRLYAPFGITKVQMKIRYCNNNVIPLLKKRNISWDMNTMRIIFCGKTFPMKYIDNGYAEEYINSLIDENGQAKLELYM